MRLAVLLALLLNIPVICSAQTTWYVPDDFSSIQSAISASSDNDTVVVKPGTYIENIDFINKKITVESSSGPSLTTIYGINHYPCVVRMTSSAILSGFTIKNGYYNKGAGIYCIGNNCIIKNNFITNNDAHSTGGSGGGIYCNGNNIIILNNTIYNNEAYEGGGIYVYSSCSNIIISNNTIHDNIAFTGGGISDHGNHTTILDNNINSNTAYGSGDGGGIRLAGSNGLIDHNFISYNIANSGGGLRDNNNPNTISNNIIANNTASTGGGLYIGWIIIISDAIIYNNLIVNNIADYGGGFYGAANIYNCTFHNNTAWSTGGGIYSLNSGMTLFNSILWENSATANKQIYGNPTVDHCDIQNGWPGSGNISSDPMFVDSINNDYHLDALSPCRDSGNNSSSFMPLLDFENDIRIANYTVDMGADEFYSHLYYTGNATPSGNIKLKFIGLPTTAINGLILGVNIFDPPLPCDYGSWYMDNPFQIMTGFGTIPADGVKILPGTIPIFPQAPYTVYLQGVIDMELTNLCIVNVQ